MKKIELEIKTLRNSNAQSQSYVVILGEIKSNRRLPVIIGSFEAQAIAVALENLEPSRPLTHDLLKNVCSEFDIQLKEVVINNLLEGIFYSKLICLKDGEMIEIDSRTSDAMALAVRFSCPIYTYEFILEKAGLTLEGGLEITETDEEENTEIAVVEKASNADEVSPESFTKHSLSQLEEMLEQAIAGEQYEKAASIRDEINQRT